MQSLQQFYHLFSRSTLRAPLVIELGHSEHAICSGAQASITLRSTVDEGDRFFLDNSILELWPKITTLATRLHVHFGFWQRFFGWQVVLLVSNSATPVQLEILQRQIEAVTLEPKLIPFSRVQEYLLGQLLPRSQEACALHFKDHQVEVTLRSARGIFAQTMWFDYKHWLQSNPTTRQRLLQTWCWQLQRWLLYHQGVSGDDVSHMMVTGSRLDQSTLVADLQSYFGEIKVFAPEKSKHTILQVASELLQIDRT